MHPPTPRPQACSKTECCKGSCSIKQNKVSSQRPPRHQSFLVLVVDSVVELQSLLCQLKSKSQVFQWLFPANARWGCEHLPPQIRLLWKLDIQYLYSLQRYRFAYVPGEEEEGEEGGDRVDQLTRLGLSPEAHVESRVFHIKQGLNFAKYRTRRSKLWWFFCHIRTDKCIHVPHHLGIEWFAVVVRSQLTSWSYLEISPGGSVYTTDSSKCYKHGPFFYISER